MTTFASLDEAYERASWASARIITDGTDAQTFREAVRVHRLASEYIARAEKLAVSKRPKTVSVWGSRIEPEHIRRGHETQKMTLQAKLDIATARYLRFVADHGGTVTSDALYEGVTVADLGGLSDARNRRRVGDAVERGLLTRTKVGRSGIVTITDKGRRWLEEAES